MKDKKGKIKNLIDIKDLSKEEINNLIEVANDIIAHKEKYSHKCDGKILATLFFEPLTILLGEML